MRNITFALLVAAILSLAVMGTASHAKPLVTETPTPTQIGDGCGEAAGIEAGATYVDVCATQTLAKITSTLTLQTQQSNISSPVAMGSSSGWWYEDDDEDGLSNGSEMSWRGQDPTNPWDNYDVAGGDVMDLLTERYPDCVIDAIDAQVLAFRWGTEDGDPLYKEAYNVEPLPNGLFADDDIDINDLQAIYGRFGRTCSPAQEPDWADNACGGKFHTVAEIQAERTAAGQAVQNAISAGGGAAGAIPDNLAGVAASSPSIVTAGESKSYCIPVYHPTNGDIIELIELTMSSIEGGASGSAAAERVNSPVANIYCGSCV